jgi:hypothetical protein
MITLHLGINDGDVEQMEFSTRGELTNFILELKRFNCIWLFTDDGENGEIIITENISILLNAFLNNIVQGNILHLHEYQSYEDAYAVALDMRESNPKCYNNEN